MNQVRVARVVTLDGPDGIELRHEDVAEPGAGEVRVAIGAMGLNRADAMFSRGQYLIEPVLPSRIGIEAAGTVTAVGPRTDGVEVGQRVAIFCAASMQQHGTAADEIVIPQRALLPSMEGLSTPQLAAFWVAHLTAYGGLVQTGELRAGQRVLLTAASSSVGLAAIDVAKRVGAYVVASTRSPDKVECLKAAGADAVVLLRHGGLEPSEGPYDLVFDAIGGSLTGTLCASLAPRGRIVIYGVLGGERRAAFDVFAAAENNITMAGFHLGYHLMAQPRRRADALGWIERQHADLPFEPAVSARFELANVADAYRSLESSAQVGKIVVEVAR